MTCSGRTTRPSRATNRCTRSMNGHLAPFRRRPEPFQLTSANPRHASSGWGETPLDTGRRRARRNAVRPALTAASRSSPVLLPQMPYHFARGGSESDSTSRQSPLQPRADTTTRPHVTTRADQPPAEGPSSPEIPPATRSYKGTPPPRPLASRPRGLLTGVAARRGGQARVFAGESVRGRNPRQNRGGG